MSYHAFGLEQERENKFDVYDEFFRIILWFLITLTENALYL